MQSTKTTERALDLSTITSLILLFPKTPKLHLFLLAFALTFPLVLIISGSQGILFGIRYYLGNYVYEISLLIYYSVVVAVDRRLEKALLREGSKRVSLIRRTMLLQLLIGPLAIVSAFFLQMLCYATHKILTLLNYKIFSLVYLVISDVGSLCIIAHAILLYFFARFVLGYLKIVEIKPGPAELTIHLSLTAATIGFLFGMHWTKY